jgi:diphthamide synthase (EF-2-diphthine--ammonia ligase)
MLRAGVEATVTCVDRTQLDSSFAGAAFDATFLDQLPQGVDPCGENGEFHTVVCDGPGFVRPVPLRVGDIVEDGSFVVVDVQSATSVQGA